MKCLICKSDKIEKIYSNYVGYVENTNFDIFHCKICGTHLISLDNINPKLYDIIYNSQHLPGEYLNYLNYAIKVKEVSNPLKYLGNQTEAYYVVYHYLKDTTGLKILEVGCGFGFLTYALNASGHNAYGIDISETVIEEATKNFGTFYTCASIKSVDSKFKKKYDVIIATEVIEHVPDPIDFLNDLKSNLKENGLIIITTPNKDFYPKNSIWKTDLPPVHISWLNKKGIPYLSRNIDMEYKIIDFSKFKPKGLNYIIVKLYTNFILKDNKQKFCIRKNGRKNWRTVDSVPITILRKIFVDFSPVRNLCNTLYKPKDRPTLGIIFRKINSIKSVKN